MSQSDPTDHALAAIASILDQPDAPHEPEKSALEEATAILAPVPGDGYSKIGPGPMVAIRFKWTARRDDTGEYYVDETIGENSRPISSGPMSKEAAIQFVDDHAAEAQRRFDQLKSEMTAAPAKVVRKDSGEM